MSVWAVSSKRAPRVKTARGELGKTQDRGRGEAVEGAETDCSPSGEARGKGYVVARPRIQDSGRVRYRG